MKYTLAGPAAVLAGGFLMILSLSAALVILLADAYRDIGRHAEDDAARLAFVVEREISRNVDLLDLSIQAVADGVEQPDVMRLPVTLRDQALFSRAAAARYIRNVAVFDRHGNLIADSLETGARPSRSERVSAADLRLARRTNQLLVGHPYMTSDTMTRLVTLSRAVRTPNGRFDGVVIATVNLDYFSEVLSGLQIDAHGVVSVSLRDGTALMSTLAPERQRPVPDSFGRWMGERFAQWFSRALHGSSADDAITAQRTVPGTPMIVDVSLPSSQVFADWKRRCEQVAILGVIVSLGFAALSVYLAYTLRMRARLDAVVQRLATTDALTDLHNRWAFDRAYKHEVEKARKTGQPISVLFVDVDHFKRFNDRYGHVAGDRALQAVAQVLKSSVRRGSDFVSRYGGEEFVVLLPGVDAKAAVAMAERLRLAVEELAIAHEAVEGGILTSSIGVASIDNTEAQHDVEHLLEDADRALYSAKEVGRNRVMMCMT
ncbi:diguanylate cyclase [Burkholderia sp. WAC0059]|uniref:GGDEF domain-containing protein n=1 Tax=Burkholderia sp. WAC0059 TaxID=2066022 RepID=UPI000C7EEE1D|nr:sensor domain-containing diguanylate cyclase [Burkholderia sp. WAC0059]PLZ00050.1 diguanylate cyclase [Burkholderia sp. WAC0059]